MLKNRLCNYSGSPINITAKNFFCTPHNFFVSAHTINRVRNGRVKTATVSLCGAVAVGQRLMPGRQGSVSAGGQIGKLSSTVRKQSEGLLPDQ